MQQPFQCIEICLRDGLQNAQVLIGACGPYLYSMTMAEGKIISKWPVREAVSLPCLTLQAFLIMPFAFQ